MKPLSVSQADILTSINTTIGKILNLNLSML